MSLMKLINIIIDHKSEDLKNRTVFHNIFWEQYDKYICNQVSFPDSLGAFWKSSVI